MGNQTRVEELEAQLAALQPAKTTPTQEPAPIQPSNAMTADFRSFVLWNTWRYGKNGGEGNFEDWVQTEGKRLKQIHDQRILQAIEQFKCKKEYDSETSRMWLAYLESELSWNYYVPAQFRQHSSSFKVLTE